jgi:squalene-hopene/tetraprenyl-beta-curcumene cyclase
MQCRNGGWGSFDKDNTKMIFQYIPFADHNAMLDPPTVDITGRILEMLSIYGYTRKDRRVERAVKFILSEQEPDGSWFGRWGVNYVYGTSNVLNGLVRQRIPASDPMVARALDWLVAVQNPDGGWGEGLESYADRARMGRGPSTASQTAWGLMGLLAYRPASDSAVRRGVAWLVDRQLAGGADAGSWSEEAFTGTGFPRHFYLRYHLYRHVFPLMALGRFCAAAGS